MVAGEEEILGLDKLCSVTGIILLILLIGSIWDLSVLIDNKFTLLNEFGIDYVTQLRLQMNQITNILGFVMIISFIYVLRKVRNKDEKPTKRKKVN